jgi:hypothetical protein
VLTVRTVEAAELLAADMFKAADSHGRLITFGDVEHYLAALGGHEWYCGYGR